VVVVAAAVKENSDMDVVEYTDDQHRNKFDVLSVPMTMVI
jgi:hypothetical protein